MENDQIIIN